ncbi:phage tail protein I (plasmid) [Tistrella mobilis]|uniref:phage tail protein I n=1 Tax=Tistrella mobilis TaxID=171437 RepID=UPI0035590407
MAERRPSILPPNSTRLERAVEQVSARVDTMPVPIAATWDVAACPEALLPWLAWAVGVDYWRSTWPEGVKRAVIRGMLETRATRGTPAAVRSALQALGTRIVMREWWEAGREPYTVAVEAYANDYADRLPEWSLEDLARDLTEILRRTAPVRVHFDIQIGADFSGLARIAGALNAPVIVSTDIASTPEPAGAVSATLATAAALTRPTALGHAGAAVPLVPIAAEAAPVWRVGAALTRPTAITDGSAAVPLVPLIAAVATTLRHAAALHRPVVIATGFATA